MMKDNKIFMVLATSVVILFIISNFDLVHVEIVMQTHNEQNIPTLNHVSKTKDGQTNSKVSFASLHSPGENPGYFTPRETRVTPLDFKFLISSDVCKNGHIDLVIILISMTTHREYRDAIRDTWGGVNGNNTWAGVPLQMKVRLIFVLGFTNTDDTKSLILEAKDKNDLILTDVKEDYFNLSYKVLMAFKWIKENCKNVRFIMKNDEDSIVHIPWLLKRLQLPSWNSTIVGPYFTKQVREVHGTYGVDPKNYPFELYPPYVKGNVYVMPAKIAFKILEVSEYMPYVNMEDAHVTGILARCVHASHTAIHSQEYSPNERPGVCDIVRRKKFAGRDLSTGYLREVWTKVLHPETCK